MSACDVLSAPTPRPAPSLNLAARRQQRGITLDEITAATKIGLHFLRAIEAENFAALPGGLYNTSYIRQYARAVSFDENELIEHYRALTQPDPAMAHELRGEHGVHSFMQMVQKPRRSPHAA